MSEWNIIHQNFHTREREYNKVQACLLLETFYPKFSPILGLFQGLPGRLDWFLMTDDFKVSENRNAHI